MFKTLRALKRVVLVSILCVVTGIQLPVASADESASVPRPIPLTRPEMKQYLEDMKARKPRIPLPELTEEEKAKLGERGTSYEGRLRALYMPAGDSRGGFSSGVTGAGGTRPDRGTAERTTPGGSGGFGRENDPAMTLDYRFKTQLFWIVSRTNNCQY